MIPIGKVPVDILQRHVYQRLGRRVDFLVHARVGEDCAVLFFGENACIATTDPLTGATGHLGRLAVHVACNDVAATGGEPVALLLNLLLRPGVTETELREIMRDAGAAAASIGVEIVGGHTEVTDAVSRHVAVATAIGRAPRDGILSTGNARSGQALIMTKAAGLQGTAILAEEHGGFFLGRLGDEVVTRAQSFVDEISVVRDGCVAADAGAVAMHDATEGGILGASLEMALGAACGVEVWMDRIPVRAETDAVCGALGIDPLGLVSSGSLLIATPDAPRMLAALQRADVAAAEIGRFVDGASWSVAGCERRPLETYARDELWRAFELLAR